jgi:hypothetical protein
VQAKIEGDHETGKLKIVTKNVGGFQVDLFNLLAQEFNDQAVEEFAKYFIGRPNKWDEISKRSVLAVRPVSAAPKPRTEPQYVVHHTPAPPPEPEKRSGLLGSISSILKKKD